MFKSVDPKANFPQIEEEILSTWRKNKTFEKSVEKNAPKGDWTFLDGPPFVTGMPHYGHLLGSIHKDVFGRFYTMKGYRVRRVWGWDGHGLPVENKVENKLEIKRKKDIEEIVGVKKFIDECKAYVEQISGEWEWYVDHIGRWVDFKNAYKTWDMNYMESVMWVFKQMYDRKHIYKGLKVTLFCPHCSTPISNFEVAMDADNYKDLTDSATTYKYELEGEKNTFILAWSTTPWNKIVTPALAVNPNLIYVKVKQNDEYYILAKTTIKTLGDVKTYEIVEEFDGKSLIGKKYIPHYDYYKNKIKEDERAFEIIGGEFVTAEEGTGVVTIAAYGEEDLKAMNENNIHKEMHVDEEGMIKDDVPIFGGMYYLKANKAVNEDLSSRGLVYKDEELLHSVPLCWRCHTRLYYAPIDAWYVNIQNIKDLLIKTNEEVNWFPKHFKHGRFLKSLENAPDWNISRNRYWGSPVPVWECECGERFVPGSIKELEEASGKTIKNLHKPDIDEVEIDCRKCGKKVKRVPEVLDSWIEAGSASFAERHYPFEGEQKLEEFFPPDFIAEYTGQIRAWFYVLHVIGGALYKSKAFKNVGVEGVILGTDGRKMSKNLGNYPDPKELLAKYGGDALRLYLMSSPIMNGEDIIISEEQYREQVKGLLLILWNTYNFFISYANVDDWSKEKITKDSENILDKWVIALLNQLTSEVTKDLDNFDTVSAISKINKFINDFSTWYIRRSRDRVGASMQNTKDKNDFYSTTYEVLTTLCKILAPITPFTVEEMYKNLTEEESVHLTDWPESKAYDINLIFSMERIRGVVVRIHSIRKEKGIKVRQPLSRIGFFGEPLEEKERIKPFEEILKSELNLKNIDFMNYSDMPKGEFIIDATENDDYKKKIGLFLDIEITPALKAEGDARDLVRKIQEERKMMGTSLSEKVNVSLESWPEEFEEEIKRKALINNLTKGEFKVTKV